MIFSRVLMHLVFYTLVLPKFLIRPGLFIKPSLTGKLSPVNYMNVIDMVYISSLTA